MKAEDIWAKTFIYLLLIFINPVRYLSQHLFIHPQYIPGKNNNKITGINVFMFLCMYVYVCTYVCIYLFIYLFIYLASCILFYPRYLGHPASNTWPSRQGQAGMSFISWCFGAGLQVRPVICGLFLSALSHHSPIIFCWQNRL